MTNKGQTQAGIWWLTPAGLVVGLLVPLFLVIVFLGQINSPALTVRGLIFFDAKYAALGIAYMAVIAVMAWVGQNITLSDHGPILERRWSLAAWILGLASAFAYLIWFKEILFSPSNLIGTLTGAIKLTRKEIGHATGVTSLVNFTPVFFSLLSYVWVKNKAAVSPALKSLAVFILMMTALRVYAWSERLALIETMIAIGVPAAAVLNERLKSRAGVRIIKILPFIGFPFLVVYFGIAEYFRSWQSDFYNGTMPFWEFALGRLAAYYYTSLNNGAGVLETQLWPTYQMENIMLFLHKAPAMVGAIFRFYTDVGYSDFSVYLEKYGDPEFNNPSGIYSVVYDIGLAGAAIYFAFVGFFAGILSTALLRGQLRGVLFYPPFFITLLEIYRYPYLGHSRTFTLFLGALVVLFIMSKRRG